MTYFGQFPDDPYYMTAEEEMRISENDMRIITSEQLPGCWVAYTDNYDGPGSPIGSGMSEQEAIDDLLDQLEED